MIKVLKIKHLILVLGCFTLLAHPSALLFGQNQIDPDALFLQARQDAFDGKYESARTTLNTILTIDQNYHDASILKARTWAWEGQYDSARSILADVRSKSPRNRDALYAAIDVEMWSENYSDAIRLLDKALLDQPSNLELLYRKALAFHLLGDDTAAVLILNQILTLDPTYEDALALLNRIEGNRLLNHFGAGYRGQFFVEEENQSPWHLFYAEVGRKTRFAGPVVLRSNIANRFENTGIQIEADAYPTIRPGTYLYLNAGFSPDEDLFPTTRFGFEVFQKLPFAWEASLGFRMLNFEAMDLFILTGSVSKYYNQYYFSLRPYISFSSSPETPEAQSVFFTARRFFSSPDHYLSLTVGRGFSADLDQIIANEIYDLGGTVAEMFLLYQQKISNPFLFRVGAGYRIYNEATNPVVAEAGIIYRF